MRIPLLHRDACGWIKEIISPSFVPAKNVHWTALVAYYIALLIRISRGWWGTTNVPREC